MKSVPAWQRAHLVQVYKDGGYKASKPVAIEFGISPNTVLKYVRIAGVKPPVGKNNRGGHNRKITKEQRDEVLRVFLSDGPAAAVVLTASLGLSAKYAHKLAAERGFAYRYPRPPGKPRAAKVPRAKPVLRPARQYNYWTNHEIERLRACYAVTPRKELALLFPRHPIQSIIYTAKRRLRLRKSRGKWAGIIAAHEPIIFGNFTRAA